MLQHAGHSIPPPKALSVSLFSALVDLTKCVLPSDILHDECMIDHDCGNRLLCCEKKWCDVTSDCGSARYFFIIFKKSTCKFCLPSCELSKRTHLTEDLEGATLIDIIYD
uniref:WAP domain-containing protein n=1 Tax=Heterorhabditis bacteriophora TaxID=37862 RepID=A0A1I7W9S2_HETBA